MDTIPMVSSLLSSLANYSNLPQGSKDTRGGGKQRRLAQETCPGRHTRLRRALKAEDITHFRLALDCYRWLINWLLQDRASKHMRDLGCDSLPVCKWQLPAHVLLFWPVTWSPLVPSPIPERACSLESVLDQLITSLMVLAFLRSVSQSVVCKFASNSDLY